MNQDLLRLNDGGREVRRWAGGEVGFGVCILSKHERMMGAAFWMGRVVLWYVIMKGRRALRGRQ